MTTLFSCCSGCCSCRCGTTCARGGSSAPRSCSSPSRRSRCTSATEPPTRASSRTASPGSTSSTRGAARTRLLACLVLSLLPSCFPSIRPLQHILLVPSFVHPFVYFFIPSSVSLGACSFNFSPVLCSFHTCIFCTSNKVHIESFGGRGAEGHGNGWERGRSCRVLDQWLLQGVESGVLLSAVCLITSLPSLLQGVGSPLPSSLQGVGSPLPSSLQGVGSPLPSSL